MARAPKKKAAAQSPGDRTEWAIGIASGAVTLAVMAYLVFEAVVSSGGVPSLRVEQRLVRQVASYYVVDVTVANDGGATATDVVVEGRLGPAETAEVATVTVDYVPPGPGVPAILVFSRDPAGEDLGLSIKGYTRP